MYETWLTPSFDWEKSKDHYQGKTYECGYCGCSLQDHEVFLSGGSSYCGCCK